MATLKVSDDFMDEVRSVIRQSTALVAPVADGVGIVPIDAPFVYTPEIDPATLSVPTNTGLEVLNSVAGAQVESIDPLNGDHIVELKPPAGGWRWETTSDPGNVYPVTVYGFSATQATNNKFLGCVVLDSPVEFTGDNQSFTLDSVKIRIPAGAM